MDAVELAPGHRQVARDPRARGEHERIVALVELVDRDVGADVDAVAELDTLGRELRDAALDQPFLDLELRHPEADEPARRLVALVDDHGLAGACQLLRARQSRRA